MKAQLNPENAQFIKENFYKLTVERNYASDLVVNRLAESEYQMQAIKFLLHTKTTCDIVKTGLSSPSWNTEASVNKYSVTLKNSRHSYTFEFFDSIHNTQNNKSAKYDFYSVLACLSFSTPESFDDFCADFGYEFKNESEYIKAKSTHLACLDQDKNLRKLFTAEQREQLQEIN